MTDCVEIAMTADMDAQHWSCSAWDVRTGTQLKTYKTSGPLASKSVHCINNQYLVGGKLTKPFLTMWPINQQVSTHLKYMLPDLPGPVAISPDGNYCVVGHSQSFSVYNLATGINIAPRTAHHYGAITVIKFTDDGSHFITASGDCRLAVWNLSRTVQHKDNKMLYELTDCTLPITDMYVGKGGMKATLAISSLDRSCKLYELATGKMLLNVIFPSALSVMTINALETELFVGDKQGIIYFCHLAAAPRSRELHLSQDKLQKSTFKGHTKAVTCLSMSMDNETLLSGGEDELVIVWHVKTQQQLRIIPHKGAITNAFFLVTPRLMFDRSRTITVPFPPFQKASSTKPDLEKMSFAIPVKKYALRDRQNQSQPFTPMEETRKDKEVLQLEQEVEKLKSINQQLYHTSLQILMNNDMNSKE